jgi:hypothetical protein
MPFASVRSPGLSDSYYLEFKYAGFPRDQVFSQEVSDAQHSRWGGRGWVSQESNSASRKLLFGNSNLHYYSFPSVKSMGFQSKKARDDHPMPSATTQSKEDLYRGWALAIREYSRFEDFSFTQTKDILPALSALAS